MAAHLLPSCALFLALLGTAPGARGPVVPSQPFTTVWNANTQWCLERHGVDVDVSVFDVVANPGQTFLGPDMTIFYSSQLGTYPYYTAAGEPVFGGLPQNASLDAHLARAHQDVLAAMPAAGFSGLAVIDWEAWRPRWAFNWDAKDVYRQRSRALVRGQHPDWPAPWVEAAAQAQFQGAAQAWMGGTLRLGRALRPRGLWGFYGFPDCYNSDFQSPNYTGECPPGVRAQNDQLGWLWAQSRALYPSIYLPAALEGTGKAQAYVRHRVGEAFRVAGGAGALSLPVLPYVQIFYDFTSRFLPLVSPARALPAPPPPARLVGIRSGNRRHTARWRFRPFVLTFLTTYCVPRSVPGRRPRLHGTQAREGQAGLRPRGRGGPRQGTGTFGASSGFQHGLGGRGGHRATCACASPRRRWSTAWGRVWPRERQEQCSG